MELMLIFHPERGMYRVEKGFGERLIEEGTYFDSQMKADEAREKNHGGLQQQLQDQGLHAKRRKRRSDK